MNTANAVTVGSKRLKDLTKSVKLVQVTDPHLFGDETRALRGVPTLPALRATLAAARADIEAADAVLATGDLVQDDPAGYVHFRREFAALGRPVLCIPGNHDVPEIRTALAGPPFQLGGLHDAGAWRIVLLDSTVPGQTHGRLGDAELARLDAALADAGERHVLVCLHHHPVPLDSRWLDQVGLVNGAQLLALLGRHRNVRGVVFGHVHQAREFLVDGRPMIATPSTCSQFRPLSDEFAVDDKPPAWRTLTLHPEGRIETELKWVQGFAP